MFRSNERFISAAFYDYPGSGLRAATLPFAAQLANAADARPYAGPGLKPLVQRNLHGGTPAASRGKMRAAGVPLRLRHVVTARS